MAKSKTIKLQEVDTAKGGDNLKRVIDVTEAEYEGIQKLAEKQGVKTWEPVTGADGETTGTGTESDK